MLNLRHRCRHITALLVPCNGRAATASLASTATAGSVRILLVSSDSVVTLKRGDNRRLPSAASAMAGKAVLKWSKQITTSHVEQLIRSEKDLRKAISIFDSATAEYPNGFRHDGSTFGLMISRLVSANQFKPAEELIDRMKEEKCEVAEDVFLALCRGYGRVHKPHDVIRIFQNMNEFHLKPTEKSYVTVMSILVDENQLKLAIRFYRYMRKMGFPPSVVSLNVLIKAFCKNDGTIDAALKVFHEMPNRGCDPDSYTYGTLISGLCRFRRTEEANELFHRMWGKDCLPTVVTYTSLIRGLCQSEKLEEAVELFKDMTSRGIKPNVFTYSSLMSGLCKNGCSSQALKLLEMMTKKGLSPNVVTYGTLIHGLCKEGAIREALELFDRMKLQGLKPDAGLYWKIINGFCDIGKFHEAANFVDEMVLLGVPLNRLTWSSHVKIHNTVVRGLCTKADHDRVFKLYLSMRGRGISTEPETYDAVVRCLCEKGGLNKASRVINEMIIDGCVPDKTLWADIMCGLWNKNEMHEDCVLLLAPLISRYNAEV